MHKFLYVEIIQRIKHKKIRPFFLVAILSCLSLPLSAGFITYGRGDGGGASGTHTANLDVAAQSQGYGSHADRERAIALGYDGSSLNDALTYNAALGLTSISHPTPRTLVDSNDDPLTANHYEVDCDDFIETLSSVSGTGCADLTKLHFLTVQSDTDRSKEAGYDNHMQFKEAQLLNYQRNCTDSAIFLEAIGRNVDNCFAAELTPQSADTCSAFIIDNNFTVADGTPAGGCDELLRSEYTQLPTWLAGAGDRLAQDNCYADAQDRQRAEALDYDPDTCADGDLWAMAKGLAVNPHPSSRGNHVLRTADNRAIAASQYELDCDGYIARTQGVTGDGCTALTKTHFTTVKPLTDAAVDNGYVSDMQYRSADALGYMQNCGDADLYHEAQQAGRTTSLCDGDALSGPSVEQCTDYIAGMDLRDSANAVLTGCPVMTRTQFVAMGPWLDGSADRAAQENCYADEFDRNDAMALGYDGNLCSDGDLWAAAKGMNTNPHPSTRETTSLRNSRNRTFSANYYESECDAYIADGALATTIAGPDGTIIAVPAASGDGCADLHRHHFVTVRNDVDTAYHFGYDSRADRAAAAVLLYGDSCADSDLYNEARARSAGGGTGECGPATALTPPPAAQCTAYIDQESLSATACSGMNKTQYTAFKNWLTSDANALANCYERHGPLGPPWPAVAYVSRTHAESLGYDPYSCADADLYSASFGRMTNPALTPGRSAEDRKLMTSGPNPIQLEDVSWIAWVDAGNHYFLTSYSPAVHYGNLCRNGKTFADGTSFDRINNHVGCGHNNPNNSAGTLNPRRRADFLALKTYIDTNVIEKGFFDPSSYQNHLRQGFSLDPSAGDRYFPADEFAYCEFHEGTWRQCTNGITYQSWLALRNIMQAVEGSTEIDKADIDNFIRHHKATNAYSATLGITPDFDTPISVRYSFDATTGLSETDAATVRTCINNLSFQKNNVIVSDCLE